MKKNIIYSNNEPDKNNIWLKVENGKPTLSSFENGEWAQISSNDINTEQLIAITKLTKEGQFKGGCIRGTFDPEVVQPPFWIWFQEVYEAGNMEGEDYKKCWRLTTEEEVDAEKGTFEIWFDKPLKMVTEMFGYNGGEFVSGFESCDLLRDGITTCDITGLNISELESLQLAFAYSPLLRKIYLPEHFPKLKSIFQMCRKSTNITYCSFFTSDYPLTLSMAFLGATRLSDINIPILEASEYLNHIFKDCPNLIKIPIIDCANVSAEVGATDNCTYYTFYDATSLEEIRLTNVDNITNFNAAFQSTPSLKRLICDFSNVTRMQSTFNRCGLEEYPVLNTEKVYYWRYTFYNDTKAKKIPHIDFSSATYWQQVFYNCTNLRYMEAFGIGNTDITFTFSEAANWGTGSEESRQSLVRSLLNNSYNRAANGKSPITIKLSATSKALLTEEEILAITNKGYTIA